MGKGEIDVKNRMFGFFSAFTHKDFDPANLKEYYIQNPKYLIIVHFIDDWLHLFLRI